MKKTCKSFLSDPVPFNGQGYEKQKGLELVTSRSSSCKKQVQKNSFVMFFLTKVDDVIKSVFELF